MQLKLAPPLQATIIQLHMHQSQLSTAAYYLNLPVWAAPQIR
jgi:hypothetical protein